MAAALSFYGIDLGKRILKSAQLAAKRYLDPAGQQAAQDRMTDLLDPTKESARLEKHSEVQRLCEIYDASMACVKSRLFGFHQGLVAKKNLSQSDEDKLVNLTVSAIRMIGYFSTDQTMFSILADEDFLRNGIEQI